VWYSTIDFGAYSRPLSVFGVPSSSSCLGTNYSSTNTRFNHSLSLPVLSRFYSSSLPTAPDPMSEIITTVGATEAIFSTIMAFISPGDKVLLMSPHYDSYPASVIMAGGEPVFVRMVPKGGETPKTSDDWEVDWASMEKILEEDSKSGKKIKIVLLNNPHNPLGGYEARKGVFCSMN